jgi:hypothetical protein
MLDSNFIFGLLNFSKNILINYCADCCSTYVETWEKLIHYNCVKSCVSVSRNYEKELRDKFNRP